MGAHRSPVLGHIDCPVCGLDMDVKKDKNGHAMGYCPDCSQQLFTRNDYRSARLLGLMRPLAPEPAAPSAGGQPLSIPQFLPSANPAPKPQAGAQGANEVADKETPAPAKKIEPAAATQAAGSSPKPRAAWFAGLQPIVKGKADGK